MKDIKTRVKSFSQSKKKKKKSSLKISQVGFQKITIVIGMWCKIELSRMEKIHVLNDNHSYQAVHQYINFFHWQTKNYDIKPITKRGCALFTYEIYKRYPKKKAPNSPPMKPAKLNYLSTIQTCASVVVQPLNKICALQTCAVEISLT